MAAQTHLQRYFYYIQPGPSRFAMLAIMATMPPCRAGGWLGALGVTVVTRRAWAGQAVAKRRAEGWLEVIDGDAAVRWHRLATAPNGFW